MDTPEVLDQETVIPNVSTITPNPHVETPVWIPTGSEGIDTRLLPKGTNNNFGAYHVLLENKINEKTGRAKDINCFLCLVSEKRLNKGYTRRTIYGCSGCKRG